MSYVITPPAQPTVEVRGTRDRFPVRRIFCVGRNYAAHAREMGNDDREPPFFFTKPADAVVASGSTVPYPPRTSNFHHEVELVVALGDRGSIYGYAVGIDLTRRDLQSEAKDNGRPWDTSKAFDYSAPIGAIRAGGSIENARIWLSVNGKIKQDANVSEMTWKVPEIIAELSTLFTLAAGDLIYTGTPAGVGALAKGDVVEAGIEGLDPLKIQIKA